MLIKAPKGDDDFGGVGGHFGGEGNILASMRLKDRITPEGKKLLHLEELQSDWHQQGREKGYNQKVDKLPEGYRVEKSKHHNSYNVFSPDGDLYASGMRPETATANAIDNLNRSGVPDAPFKKNWEEMALKRLIHHAAENGYHGIVVTPGMEQAKRYNLGNQLHSIQLVSPNKDSLQDSIFNGYPKEGNQIINRLINTPEELHELVGKEAAEKLMQQKHEKGTAGNKGAHVRKLEGVDLEVGGEGMKGFYDKKVPNILNAIGKKHGVKTQLHGHHIETRPAKVTPQIAAPGIGHFPEPIVEPAQTKALHHFPITEPMRQDILTNGLPLYAEGGIIRKAEGGNVQLTVEQMRQQLIAAGKNLPNLTEIGAEEAPSMPVKDYVVPNNGATGSFPMGGVDMSPQQPGQQMLPANLLQPQGGQQPQGEQGAPQGQPAPLGSTGSPPPAGGSNILQMTQQGQALNAMKPLAPMPQMAVGGPVPVMNHPFQASGDRPLPFMAKEGGSDNAPMNNDYSDNGATDYDMDNIQQLAMGGGVQGYASKGYVVHEPQKPHPEVGSRYKAVQLPGLMPEHPVDLEQLYNDKASIQMRPWDATNRHVNVTNVSGHDLLNPLTTEGGQPFARDIELNKKGIVSASNEGIQRKIQSRANAAHEENIKQGGKGHTYDIISTMDAPAPFFTNMPLHIQLDLLKQRQLKPEQLKYLADKVRAIKVRNQKTKEITTPYVNMLPLDHPELWDQMMKGGHGIGAPGKLRTALSATLGQVGQQKLLDYNLPDLMNAITDPEIRKAPATYAGNTFLANIPYADVGPQHHSIYDRSGYGEYGGKGPHMPAEFYMIETFDRVLDEMQKKYPNAGASALRALAINALQTRAGGVSQMVNDRVLRNAERFTKDTKSGEISDPHDLWNVIGHFHKKYGGYKKGGKVKDAKVTDNLDTMRLALTRKKKAAK
jgi:hypothetical protein